MHFGALLAILLLFLFSTPAPAQKWSFVFFSDTQDPGWGQWMNTNIMAELAVAIADQKPDFVLFGGDLANHPQPPVPPVWTNIMTPVYQQGIPIYAVLGNHDHYEIPGFIRAFGAVHPDNGPAGEVDLTYSFVHRDALIVGLNALSPTNEYRLAQGWLDAVLATNRQPHIFVFSHPPAFKLSHGNCLGAYPAQRDAFWRSLSRAGARLYFCGHDHFYDHSRLDDGDGDPNNDLHQLIVGTGGAAFYPDSRYDGANGGWTPVRVHHEADFGFLLAEVDGDRVTTVWKRRTAPFRFENSADLFSYTVPIAPRIGIHFSPGKLILTWSSPAVLQSSADVLSGFTTVPGATSPYTVTNFSERLFFRLARP